MKIIQKLGIIVFLIGLTIFTGSIFLGNFSLTEKELDTYITEKGYKNKVIKEELLKAIVTQEKINIFQFSDKARTAFKNANKHYDKLIAKYNAEKNWSKKGQQYQYKINGKPHTLSYQLAKKSGSGFIKENTGLMWFLTFGLGIVGALLFIIPNLVLLGKPGIKNDGIYLESSTNRGWMAWLVLVYLVTFYLVLYFMADYAVNWTFILDPISKALNGGEASQWFVYGFLYCTIMLTFRGAWAGPKTHPSQYPKMYFQLKRIKIDYFMIFQLKISIYILLQEI